MIGALQNRPCRVGRVYPRAQRAAKRRNPTFCNPNGINAEFYFIRCVECSLKLLEVPGCIIVTRNRVALCRPVTQINQFAAFATKRTPGVIVPTCEAFALGAGVGLGGFLGRGLVSHDEVCVSIHLRGVVWVGMLFYPPRIVYTVLGVMLGVATNPVARGKRFMSDYAFRLI